MSSHIDAIVERLIEETNRVRELYGPVRLWPDNGTPMTPASKDFALIVSQKYGRLFGYYHVIQTSEGYVFMLMERREVYGHWHLTPEFLFVPLAETMGVGDFDDVTPEKIKALA